MQLVQGKQSKPQRVVIYAPEGIGKTTLASQFPKPLFIDIEGGSDELEVTRTPKPSSWSMLTDQVNQIRSDAMGFQTVVIDTADWAERLCERHVCDQAGMVSIEDFGYGKGFTKAAEEWSKFFDQLNTLRDAGLNIVILAHSHLKKFEQPDETGAYDRYEMKLSKKAAPILKEWADMVLFCNYEVFVVEDEKTKSKKAQGGQRVIHTEHHACWDAKNRHGLPAKLQFPKVGAFDQIAHCFPMPGNVTAVTKTQADHVADEAHSNAPEVEDHIPMGGSVGRTQTEAFPAPLFDLMVEHKVQEAEIQQVVASKGYYPIDTPVGNYAEDFVNGVLVAAWPQVHEAIINNRKEQAA